MTEPTERDRELAAYWTERGDFRAWLARIIAQAREEGRQEAMLELRLSGWWAAHDHLVKWNQGGTSADEGPLLRGDSMGFRER
jgi:hypothetical protein